MHNVSKWLCSPALCFASLEELACWTDQVHNVSRWLSRSHPVCTLLDKHHLLNCSGARCEQITVLMPSCVYSR